MRLHSTKFAFLLLLLCAVQLREEYTLRLVAGAIGTRVGNAAQRFEASPARALQAQRHGSPARARSLNLEPAAKIAQSTPWTMRQPALEAAAISSHTSLIRA